MNTQNNLDAQARALGFPDHASMMAYAARQSAGLRTAPGHTQGTPAPQPAQPAPQHNQNFLGGIGAGGLFGALADLYGRATHQ